MDFDANDWPKSEIPGQKLFFAHNLDGHSVATLKSKGWEPVDVRLMPNDTDDDKREAWKAYMEGVRVGTVECDPKKFKFLEMQGKALKLLTAKELAERAPTKQLQADDLDAILNLQSERAGRGYGGKDK